MPPKMYFLFYLRTQILPIDWYVLNSKSAAFQSLWLKFGQSDAIYLLYKTVSANFNNPFHFKARAFFPQGVLTILPSSTSFFEMHDKMADAHRFALIFLVSLTVCWRRNEYISLLQVKAYHKLQCHGISMRFYDLVIGECRSRIVISSME